MTRRQLLEHVADLAGSGVEVIDSRDGWPGILRVQGWSGEYRVAAHVGPVGQSHRNRDDVERRFQNPGQQKPVTQPVDTFPVLFGVWEPEVRAGQPVLVGMEVTMHRLEASTRQSYFVPLNVLQEAQAVGWADHVSSSDEHLAVFHPLFLPVYVEMRRAGVTISAREVSSIARAAGLGDTGGDENAEERARRAAQVLVRDRAFSRAVVQAYDGLCAMCGLDFGLLEGAHILPVMVLGSPDEIWNGLALCGNHHGAFDRHRIWVNPATFEISLHPEILGQASQNAACASFVGTTEQRLRVPKSLAVAPRQEMFERRYSHFAEAYHWVR